MWAFGFLMVCTGVGVLLVSAALAVRLIRAPRPSTAARQPAEAQRHASPLEARLEEIRMTRFGAGEPAVHRRHPNVRVYATRKDDNGTTRGNDDR